MKYKSASIVRKTSGRVLIKVTFPFSYDYIAKIKTFEGYVFSSKTNAWYIPLTLENARLLERWGCNFSDELKEWAKEEVQAINRLSYIDHIPGLKGIPYEYQLEGVSFIERRKGRALIGDEMGLGKTLQALAWLQLHPELRPAIISAPASLKLNWAREAHRWMTRPRIQLLSGQTVNEDISGDIIIINHDILEYWVIELKKANPKVVVIDESHYFKSGKTMRSLALKFLINGDKKTFPKTIKHVIMLSGTPILNRPIELFFIGTLIDKTALGSYPKFTRKFCDAKDTGFGMNTSGASNTRALNRLLTDTFMIRRKKDDVLKELPPKTYSFVPLEIDNRREYDRAEANFIKFSLEKLEKQLEGINLDAKKLAQTASKANKSVQLELFSDVISESQQDLIKEKHLEKLEYAEPVMKFNELRQLAIAGKLRGVVNWIKDFLESGEKLIVFCVHRSTVEMLLATFPKISVKIDGSVTGVKRQAAVDRFQTDPKCKLFIGNSAAEEGLTLTAASNLAHAELPWNPGKTDQRNDRCHRIGQDRGVNIYYLLAENTVDDKMAAIIDLKRDILTSALDGEKVHKLRMIKELIKLYKK